MGQIMTSLGITVIGLVLCAAIGIVLCILVIRRLDRAGLSAKPAEDDDDVLELHQLSFDQVSQKDEPKSATAPEPGDAPADSPSARSLASVEFGVRPETLFMDGLRPRLECTMALLNQTKTTLVGIRISSDILIYDKNRQQAARPSGPTMRQDTVARLDPGEKFQLGVDWNLPGGLPEAMSDTAGKGAYLLARVRIIGANVAPKSQYFIFGHLLEDSRLVPLRNVPEALTNLGVTDARSG